MASPKSVVFFRLAPSSQKNRTSGRGTLTGFVANYPPGITPSQHRFRIAKRGEGMRHCMKPKLNLRRHALSGSECSGPMTDLAFAPIIPPATFSPCVPFRRIQRASTRSRGTVCGIRTDSCPARQPAATAGGSHGDSSVDLAAAAPALRIVDSLSRRGVCGGRRMTLANLEVARAG